MARYMGKPRRPAWVTVVLVVVALGIYLARGGLGGAGNGSGGGAGGGSSPARTDGASRTSGGLVGGAESDGGIARLFASRTSDTWVEAEGRVVKVLADDTSTDGGRNDRHERLLVRVGEGAGVTVLIAHNIDVAGRVPVEEGETIRFRGEYEWSEKGGTVHFTHAPKYGKKEGGWIEYRGKRYE